MKNLLSLDAHAHITASQEDESLADSGFVLAMTLNLEEAENAVQREYPHITWGVGCHPRKPKAQLDFDVDLFQRLVRQRAVVGEVGLDGGSKVPFETQLANFRQVLEVVSETPRFTSIHSHQATDQVLDELQQRPIRTPVLHWWTGSAEETTRAVDLGCYFSVHSAVARHSKFHTCVPPERILVESDHGYCEAPAAIPYRVEWVEHLMAQQLQVEVEEVRLLVWQNFSRIIEGTGTMALLPESFRRILEDRQGDIPRGM